jgi:hypothetical protein
MKNQVAFCFSVALLAAGLGLVFGYWVLPDARNAIVFDKQEIRFQGVSSMQSGEQKLTIRNVSRSPVQFDVGSECNCTFVAPARGTVEPLGTFEVLVKYRPKLQSHRMLSEERSELRFNLLADGVKTSCVLPIVAEVFKPFVADQSKMVITQFGIRPAEFEVSLSLMDDVKGLRVTQMAEFMAELNASEPQLPFNAVTLSGKIKPRSTIDNLSSDVHLVVTTDTGEEVPASVPFTLVFAEAYRLAPEPLRIKPGGTGRVVLRELASGQYRCCIAEVSSQVSGVVARVLSDTECELVATEGASGTGYVEVLVKTEDLISQETATSKKFVALLVEVDE